LFVALDSNFKLRCKARKITNPDMTHDWGYFVEDNTYNEYMKHVAEQLEVCTSNYFLTRETYRSVQKSNCPSTYQAVSQALTCGSVMYDVTGVLAAKCACHGYIMRVADLSKGKK
jgi:hypothetical protein